MNQVDTGQFHNDLKAAIMADVTLADGQGNRLTVTQIEKLQQQFEHVAHNTRQSFSEQNPAAWQNDALPKWYSAALTVFARTGSMLPVLAGLNVRPSAVRDVYRALRWTIAYLLIVASTTLVGLILYQWFVVPKIESFRADSMVPAAFGNTPSFDVLPWLPGFIVVLAVAILMGLFWIVKGGLVNVSSGLGCRRYICSALSMTVLRIAQSLVREDVAIKDAVSVGYALTGAEPDVQREVQSVLLESDEANALGRMADYIGLIANRRLTHLRLATPVLLTVAMGGGLVFIYCLIVFWPIFSMLKEVPTIGV